MSKRNQTRLDSCLFGVVTGGWPERALEPEHAATVAVEATLLIASLLPATQGSAVTWMGWLAAAWPLGLVYFVGGVVVAARQFAP